MIRLGHIEYSNCFPVHAALLDREEAPEIDIRRGIPSALNALLAAGEIDVAPSSSIEFARHADRYRIVPDVTIAADGPVRSILFETTRDPARLTGADVALPTASATSVVLLRILLELRTGARPRYHAFEQSDAADPIAAGAAAALWIGDVALRRPRRDVLRFDLGAEWREWTGLPFVFAVWQTPLGPERDAELAGLHARLLRSLDYFEANAADLADRHAAEFRLPPEVLLDYWRQLQYRLDERALQGLGRFYELAHRLGEVPCAPRPRWTPRGH